MTNPRLTPWFPADVKPVHVGVYETTISPIPQKGRWFNYWDGEGWGVSAQKIKNADPLSTSRVMWLKWRGLAEKPG